MKDKLGQEPAFPLDNTCIKQVEEGYGIGAYGIGINKRFYVACYAMQGLSSNAAFTNMKSNPKELVKFSYIIADELLRQENEV